MEGIMNLKNSLKYIVVGAVVMGIGYGIGRYLQPASVVEVEKLVEKERVKTITVTKEITKPDGTKIKETKDITDTKKETDTEKSKTVIADKPDWFIVGGYGLTQNAYTANVNRRILGNLFLGAYGTYSELSKINAGLTIGYEF
jgi:hypothetical protein